MALYIHKNGQQLGPYSITETQQLVRAGTVLATDLAWQEGLPNWIPLHQVPGFVYVPPPVPAPPAATTTPEAQHRSVAQKKSLLQKIGGGIAALAYLAFKFKFFLYGALKTVLSMLLMIALYTTVFGWRFAVGIVLLILVHELGHVAAAKWVGLPVSAPLFIPFVGAAIVMKENPRDAWTEAIMAYGGPLAGCVGSGLCLALGIYVNTPWITAIAAVSFLINIFNMIPVPPLDGGRICAAISPWFWVIGVALLAVALFYFHSVQSVIVLGIIFIFATLPRIKQTFFNHPTEELQAYYNTHITKRLLMAVLYLSLLGALVLGYWEAHNYLSYLNNNS
ncbi:MAG: GYF domain-containing protein [Methylacidiphilales bacterium]|nr:GYF domain-containing protein [Candidatus Methylacidiphilales bacterium]